MTGSLAKFSSVCIDSILEMDTRRKTISDSQNLLLSRSHFDLAPTLVIAW